jgi:hypothetical protein
LLPTILRLSTLEVRGQHRPLGKAVEAGYLADVIVFLEDLFLIDPMKIYTSKIVDHF